MMERICNRKSPSERICDNVLSLILMRVFDPNDRKSCSEVCTQWLRVEGLTRSSLKISESGIVATLLRRFPNLVSFEAHKMILSSDLQALAKTCPQLKLLNLDNSVEEGDEDGIGAIAVGCQCLTEVHFRRKEGIGEAGLIALVQSNFNTLTSLFLGGCVGVTDIALQSIADAATSLQTLDLVKCPKITDLGLFTLSKGFVSRTLKTLLLGCNNITDYGVSCLQQFCCLEELALFRCDEITDIGGVAVSLIRTLKTLDLSFLLLISDVTLIALSQNCPHLEHLDLAYCDDITGAGIRSFANHKSLEGLSLRGCLLLSKEDIEHMLFGCQSLRSLYLDSNLRRLGEEELIVRSSCTLIL